MARVLQTLYRLNATVLLTHQMDAAYWQEWTLFGLPGGVQFYLLLNLPLVWLVLYGDQALARGRPAGQVMSGVLAAGGLFAAGFHAAHLWAGDPGFRLPVSLGLLAATALLSVLQAALLWRTRGRPA